MSVDESPRPPQPAERPRNAAGTRLRLLEAAADLFAERGYERTTVRAIAERVGANQALLFRYFGSKHRLLTEVVARGDLEQLRATAPQDLFETALRSLLTRSAAGADRSQEVYLRSVGRGDEASGTLRELGGEYQKVLAGLSPSGDGALRADLAMAWLLGIGLMRTVAAREPLAGADPETVCRLVLATLDGFWTMPVDGPRDRSAGGGAGGPDGPETD
ncbi:TetR family transcriptional regulator [Streptomyces sp. CB00455]|uniref:TetR/AcrR family transcriptional regulator n=1 Tax=Streptomyces sp. CB00455 TaxID=1703927 RepID=UPI0009391CA4|nr:TetR/AcrR family transcriptional regulator [Streptomyces sp. CB00455]OKK15997.1 TetR family transcriptional regulator [Streptomyces sp. CB00455]